MTGAAGAAGYYVYQWRAFPDTQRQLDDNKKQLADTTTKLNETQKQLDDAKKQLSEHTKTITASAAELAQLKAQKAEADKRVAAIEEITKQFAKMVEHGDLKITARRGQLVLTLPSAVLFQTGSADLRKEGEYAVAQIAGVLKDKFPDRRFLVVGHTDNVEFTKPKGSGAPVCVATDNWQLSIDRALTVTRILVIAGMRPENLVPSGAGEHDPIASNSTADGQARNRRIEIALLPAVNELPALPASLKEETAPKK